eukprot:TRINITY_DN15684_c0_g1_i7.p1 TRINITY_DN15684_c0_g1~~TRINITY_DN15684_c0_g1_i7.p1  ORF type:complete len:273 (-),score=50.44 TRINITY_DN15684_c0_g1_i7:98-916(-)
MNQPSTPSPPSSSTKSVHAFSTPNTMSTYPSASTPSDRSGRGSGEGKGVMIKERLEKVEEYFLCYELDCRGWCEMPILFHAFSTQVTSDLLSARQEIFACKTFLPGSCECSSPSNWEIDFSPKAEKDQQLLKLQSGVYSKSWCASNDKLDVYTVAGSKEEHLGFVVSKLGMCGGSWEVCSTEGKAVYCINQNKTSFCPCSRSDTKFSIKSVTNSGNEGSISKRWNCCCVSKSNPDDCTVTFPKDAPWKHKALITAACMWLYKDVFLSNACVF